MVYITLYGILCTMFRCYIPYVMYDVIYHDCMVYYNVIYHFFNDIYHFIACYKKMLYTIIYIIAINHGMCSTLHDMYHTYIP